MSQATPSLTHTHTHTDTHTHTLKRIRLGTLLGRGPPYPIAQPCPLLMRARTCSKLLPPTNEVCEGYVFTGDCLSTGGSSSLWGVSVQGVSVQGGLCPGASVGGDLSRGSLSRGSLSGGVSRGGSLSRGVSVHGVSVRDKSICKPVHIMYFVPLQGVPKLSVLQFCVCIMFHWCRCCLQWPWLQQPTLGLTTLQSGPVHEQVNHHETVVTPWESELYELAS